MADFAWMQCETCGAYGFVTSPVSLDAEDAVGVMEADGWLCEWGRVTCPECVERLLGPKLSQGPQRQS